MPEPNTPKTAEIQILAAGEIIEHLPDYGHVNTFSEAELEEMARNYNPDYLRAPLVLDHITKGPALGWVKKLVKRGKALFAEVYDLAEGLVKDVREGRYGSISPAIDLDFKNSGKLYVKHVSFLGAANPACAGMQQPVLSAKGELIAFLSETGSKVFCLAPRSLNAEEMATMPQAQFDFENFDLLTDVQDRAETDYIDWILSRYYDVVGKVQTSGRSDKAELIRKYTDQLAEAVSKTEGASLSEKTKGGPAMPGENKELEAKVVQLEVDNKKLREEKEADLIKLREENKLQTQRVADLERKNTLQAINGDLDALVAAGKLTPAERKNGNLDTLLACLPDTIIKLADKEVPLRDHLLTFLKARPQIVDLSGRPVVQQGSGEDGKGVRPDVMPKNLTKREEAAVDQERAELASRAKEIELREKKTNAAFTYRQALILAEKENPHLVGR